MRGDIAIVKVSIASGGTSSDAIEARGYRLSAIELPAEFTGTAITFTAARTLAGTYKVVADDAGTDVSVTVAQNEIAVLKADDAACLRGLPFFKIVSGTAEAAAREVWLYLIPEG